jgi:hypothetical protein
MIRMKNSHAGTLLWPPQVINKFGDEEAGLKDEAELRSLTETQSGTRRDAGIVFGRGIRNENAGQRRKQMKIVSEELPKEEKFLQGSSSEWGCWKCGLDQLNGYVSTLD